MQEGGEWCLRFRGGYSADEQLRMKWGHDGPEDIPLSAQDPPQSIVLLGRKMKMMAQLKRPGCWTLHERNVLQCPLGLRSDASLLRGRHPERGLLLASLLVLLRLLHPLRSVIDGPGTVLALAVYLRLPCPRCCFFCLSPDATPDDADDSATSSTDLNDPLPLAPTLLSCCST